jgi:hypothetical protein
MSLPLARRWRYGAGGHPPASSHALGLQRNGLPASSVHMPACHRATECAAKAGPAIPLSGPVSMFSNGLSTLRVGVAALLKPRGETAGGEQPHRKAREMVRSMSAGGDAPAIGMCSRPAVRTSPHHGPPVREGDSLVKGKQCCRSQESGGIVEDVGRRPRPGRRRCRYRTTALARSSPRISSAQGSTSCAMGR